MHMQGFCTSAIFVLNSAGSQKKVSAKWQVWGMGWIILTKQIIIFSDWVFIIYILFFQDVKKNSTSPSPALGCY